MTLIKGYPPPGPRFRWCTKRLKLRPFREFLSSFDKYVAVTGIRGDESSTRRRYKKRSGKNDSKSVTLMPILDWTSDDVFSFLQSVPRWDGVPYTSLLNLYNNGERILFDGKPVVVRYGCWLCTVITKEKASIPCQLKRAKERILEVKRNKTYRIDGRKLSLEGRKIIAEALLEALENCPEAFDGYNTRRLEFLLTSVISCKSLDEVSELTNLTSKLIRKL